MWLSGWSENKDGRPVLNFNKGGELYSGARYVSLWDPCFLFWKQNNIYRIPGAGVSDQTPPPPICHCYWHCTVDVWVQGNTVTGWGKRDTVQSKQFWLNCASVKQNQLHSKRLLNRPSTLSPKRYFRKNIKCLCIHIFLKSCIICTLIFEWRQ